MSFVNANEKRDWWRNLDLSWKRILKLSIDINHNPSDEELDDILALEAIDCSRSGIISLEPLQYITGLRKLNCSHTRLKTLEKINGLRLIDELDCSHTNISSLEAIRGFSNLWRLDCSKTKVDSLQPLQDLNELAYLVCSHIPIDNLLPLQSLTSLRLIDCSHTLVKDLSPVRHLPDFHNVVNYTGTPAEHAPEEEGFYSGDIDPLFEYAARLIVESQIGSTSLIQRRMKLGYNRSGRLMDQLEAAGVVGPNRESAAREVLIKSVGELELLFNIVIDHQTKGYHFNDSSEAIRGSSKEVEGCSELLLSEGSLSGEMKSVQVEEITGSPETMASTEKEQDGFFARLIKSLRFK